MVAQFGSKSKNGKYEIDKTEETPRKTEQN